MLLGWWGSSWHPLTDFLVGIVIRTLLGQWGQVLVCPLANILVARAICMLLGQQGGFQHALTDFLVA